MTVRLDVYNPANDTKLGEVGEWSGLAWRDELTIPGAAGFTVDLAATDDVDLLLPASGERRRVRVNRDGVDVWAGIVQNAPGDLATDDGEGPSVTLQVDGLLAGLGYRAGGGVLLPFGGIGGRQQDPRLFGPMAFDFVERTGEWDDPTYGGLVTRVGFADRRAERFVFTERALYRRVVGGLSDRAGDSVMELTATSRVEAVLYLDGDELMRKPAGQNSVVSVQLPYDGEDHVIFLDCRAESGGGEPAVVWSWQTLTDAGTDDERRVGLFRTFDPATSVSTPSPFPWAAAEDYTNYPGATVGDVMSTVLSEAQERGAITWVGYSFDGVNDTDAQEWQERFARGFRVSKAGQVLDECVGIEGEPEMLPDGTFRYVRSRGADKTATVTIALPFRLTTTGEGPIYNHLYYETDGGFGEGTDAGSITSLGERLEDTAQLGNDLEPEQAANWIGALLNKHGSRRSEAEVDLPDDVPDLDPGDVVLGRNDVDDTAVPVRVVATTVAVDDSNGHVDRSVQVVPA